MFEKVLDMLLKLASKTKDVSFLNQFEYQKWQISFNWKLKIKKKGSNELENTDSKFEFL